MINLELPMSHNTMTVFAIYDSKSDSWSRPIFSRNAATCQRELRDVLSSGPSGQVPYAAHPEDYVLFELGTWSEFKPTIEYHQAPQALGSNLIQYMPKHVSDASAA